MHRGWIPLWRKEKEARVFKNEGLWKVYTWCLMKVSHKERWLPVTTGKGNSEVLLKPGQFLFGRESAAVELDMPPSTVWYRMHKLRSMGRITIKSDSHYSIVTVRDQKQNQSHQDEIEQPTDTKNNVKNVKNEKININEQAEALFSRYPRRTDRANSIQSIINELKSGTPIKDMEAALENYLAIIRRDGIQPKFVLGSKKFFASRWEEFKDGTDTAGFQTGQPNRYNYPKCPLCSAEVSSIKLDEGGNLIYCPYCSD